MHLKKNVLIRSKAWSKGQIKKRIKQTGIPKEFRKGFKFV